MSGSGVYREAADQICTQAVLVLKYIVPDYPFPTLYFGVANVVANGLIMLRHVYLILFPGCIADRVLALWFSGFRKIWRKTTPTIWPFDQGIQI